MLNVQVLGRPGRDNALLVTADSGQGQTRLLLDCGGHTLDTMPMTEIMGIDHLLFSHLHMDHVAGFDDFFRVNFERAGRGNHIWGPPGTARIVAHRFRGYWWNHAPGMLGSWLVHEVWPDRVQSWRFEAHEAFEVAHPAGDQPRGAALLTTPQVRVEALALRHQGTSLGYVLREPERVTVDPAVLAALGLRGGPWLAQLKAGATGTLDVNGTPRDAAGLRERLLRTEAGQSAAYLTDFLLDEAEHDRLAARLAGIETLYVEAQYAPADAELAARNHHTTSEQGARLARAAGARELVLLHVSRRYRPAEWAGMLEAAQAIFPAARFAPGWEPLR
ncbi:MBL fold metallo-hydrolase [Deinococcus sp. Leaf326]|uniref:MBL fold metallo-hydrolase n=1 Tax=Deinococcus sp. Leaf326 TaxID=1736338 RepID=UPI0006F3E0F3|nr:MBL fold metallo-hydrolase [Deinococcus sp. Leaf326]KQR04640.1 ribonuclease Z [Deinococcus sp. Leaf326]